MEQLAVRGQRRVRARAAARSGGADRARPPAPRSGSPARSAPTSCGRSSARPGIRARYPGATRRIAALRAALEPWREPRRGGAAARHLLALAGSSAAKGCGSSAATGGPTTSASAGSTTCWRRDATSTSSCSTPRSTPTPAGRRRRPRHGARWPSSPRREGSAKKDLGAIARAYGNVYVAEIALGANDLQATKALLEADAWPGPSLVIAYSTCIAHGIDMSKSMSHQKDAVRSGYWPLSASGPARPSTASRSSSTPTRRRCRSPSSWPPRHGSRCWPAPTPSGRSGWPAWPGRRRRAVALLQPARHDGAHRRPRHRRAPMATRRRGTDEEGEEHDRARHDVPRARPALADRRLAGPLPATRTRRRASPTPAPARSRCLAVRGGGRPRARWN